MSLLIMKHDIPEAFRGAISDKVRTAKEFIKEIKNCFVKNDKTKISTIFSTWIQWIIKVKGTLGVHYGNVQSCLQTIGT